MIDKLHPFRWQILLLLMGVFFISGAIFVQKTSFLSAPSVEVIEDTDSGNKAGGVVVTEISGSVVNPGVYKLELGARVEDLINAAGGFSPDANNDWIEKYINRASPIADGQKVYIPSISEQSDVGGAKDSTGGEAPQDSSITDQQTLININTASQSELESLWGIGPVTAKNIIEQRMYSSVEELLTKGIVKKNVYERNKDKLTIY